MAEGVARNLCQGQARVESAGIRPSFVHPLVIQVLSENGMENREAYSKSFEDLPREFTSSVDYCISLAEEEIRPFGLSTSVTMLHWPTIDPTENAFTVESQYQAFSKMKNELEVKIKDFLTELQLVNISK